MSRKFRRLLNRCGFRYYGTAYGRGWSRSYRRGDEWVCLSAMSPGSWSFKVEGGEWVRGEGLYELRQLIG